MNISYTLVPRKEKPGKVIVKKCKCKRRVQCYNIAFNAFFYDFIFMKCTMYGCKTTFTYMFNAMNKLHRIKLT